MVLLITLVVDQPVVYVSKNILHIVGIYITINIYIYIIFKYKKGYRLSPFATADGEPLSPKPEPIVFRVTGKYLYI